MSRRSIYPPIRMSVSSPLMLKVKVCETFSSVPRIFMGADSMSCLRRLCRKRMITLRLIICSPEYFGVMTCPPDMPSPWASPLIWNSSVRKASSTQRSMSEGSDMAASMACVETVLLLSLIFLYIFSAAAWKILPNVRLSISSISLLSASRRCATCW